MMKRQIFALLLVLLFIPACAFGGAASERTDVRVVVDGREAVSGEAYILDGVLHLPAGVVPSGIGLDVSFDRVTNTLHINSSAGDGDAGTDNPSGNNGETAPDAGNDSTGTEDTSAGNGESEWLEPFASEGQYFYSDTYGEGIILVDVYCDRDYYQAGVPVTFSADIIGGIPPFEIGWSVGESQIENGNTPLREYARTHDDYVSGTVYTTDSRHVEFVYTPPVESTDLYAEISITDSQGKWNHSIEDLAEVSPLSKWQERFPGREPVAESFPFTAETTGSKVNIREGCSTKDPVITNIPDKGSKVWVIGKGNDIKGNKWYRVRLNARDYGYILSSLLTKSEGAPTVTIPIREELYRDDDEDEEEEEPEDSSGTWVTEPSGTESQEPSGTDTQEQSGMDTQESSDSGATAWTGDGRGFPFSGDWQEIYLPDLQTDRRTTANGATILVNGSDIAAAPAGTVLGRFQFRSSAGPTRYRMRFSKPEIPARLAQRLEQRNETYLLYQSENMETGYVSNMLWIFPKSTLGNLCLTYEWVSTYVDSQDVEIEFPFGQVSWDSTYFSGMFYNYPGIKDTYFAEDREPSLVKDVNERNFPISDRYLDIVLLILR